MFSGCNSLESINLSNFNTSSARNMQGMFFSCNSLRFLDLSNFDTSKVYNMENMFNGCSSLRFLDISNFNLKNLGTCSEMFSNCKNLGYIKLLDIQTSTTFLNYIKGENGLNNIDNLMVCQNSDIITNKNAKFICCDYNNEIDLCLWNYIILYYNEDTTYNGNFINQYRNNISYIVHENKKYNPNDT